MKKAYQIEERRAIEKFRSHLVNDPGAIQMVLPLAEIAQMLRHGVRPLLLQAQLQLLTLIIEDEVRFLTGERYARENERDVRRWGHEEGAVVINGQKAPIVRPRVRSAEGEKKLGSYELFKREEEMQRQVWDRITRGITMRGYGPVIRECESAFGLEKSAVSEKFVMASAQRVDALLKRNLKGLRFCALMMDGVEYKEQHLVTALGIESTGRKMILGFHQGASENHAACEALLGELVERGLDFRQPHLNIIDGGKGLRAAVRKCCGEESLVQRCQLHKRRNVCEHFAAEDQPQWDRKLANAYDLRDYKEAKTALLRIHRELMDVNPSAARSLEEGMEETLTLHRLRVPTELWRTLRSTNPIESAFSIVRVVCRNVKRWRTGNQLERWVGSGLIVAEKQFRKIVGYRALPSLVSILDTQSGKGGGKAKVA